jgi:hypothetical protein
MARTNQGDSLADISGLPDTTRAVTKKSGYSPAAQPPGTGRLAVHVGPDGVAVGTIFSTVGVTSG